MTAKPSLLIAIVVAALAAGTGPGRAAENVSIGIVGAVSDITLFLAEKKGYFRDEGLNANLLTFDSGAKMVAPLGAGQLDVGAGAWSAGLFNAVGRGIDIKIVADKATNKAPFDYRVVIVRSALIDQGQVKSFADLKGRKIGITAKGAADESSLNEAMKTAHLTPADIERVYLGFSAQLVALSNGGIDAAFSAEPDATIAVRKHIAAKFAPNSTFYPVQETGVILFGSNLLEKRRDIGVKFMRAYLRAVRFYDGALRNGHIAGPGADAVIAALMELTKTTDASVFREMTPSWCNPDGKTDRASFNKDLAFFRAEGTLEGAVSGEKVLDGSFVEAALKTLGPDTGPRN